MTKDQINQATNLGVYVGGAARPHPGLHLVLGGRGQYSIARCATASSATATSPTHVDFFAASPSAGFVWRVAPTAQVFGNASRSYEPPLLLELTSPGQLEGDLSQLAAAEVLAVRGGHARQRRGAPGLGRPVYDIELWDEIQNVNVQPFPFAPLHHPALPRTSTARATPAWKWGVGVLLLEDIAPASALGPGGDSLRARTSYTWSRFVFVDDPNFGDNDLPGAPRPLPPRRAPLRPHLRVLDRAAASRCAARLLRQPARTTRARERLHTVQRAHGIRLQAVEPRASFSRGATSPAPPTPRRCRWTRRTGASSSPATAAPSTAASSGGGSDGPTRRARRCSLPLLALRCRLGGGGRARRPERDRASRHGPRGARLGPALGLAADGARCSPGRPTARRTSFVRARRIDGGAAHAGESRRGYRRGAAPLAAAGRRPRRGPLRLVVLRPAAAGGRALRLRPPPVALARRRAELGGPSGSTRIGRSRTRSRARGGTRRHRGVSWIDGREGPPNPATWMARVLDRGGLEPSARLDDETCVCCRVAVRGARRHRGRSLAQGLSR